MWNGHGPLPPGTILQLLYLQERLSGRAPGRFVEVGIGQGALSAVLLRMGWTGAGYDLNADALKIACARNAAAVAAGNLTLHHGDWLRSSNGSDADLIVASMVIEHLSEQQVGVFFERAEATLRSGGLVVLLVPASPRHWGIEDEVAGHVRRYDRGTLTAAITDAGWSVVHLAGLTYPLSNLLLRASNSRVARAESARLQLTPDERTVHSGNRAVRWKTAFPAVAGIVLNSRTLYPFHLLQKAGRRREGCLVLYGECRPAGGSVPARAAAASAALHGRP